MPTKTFEIFFRDLTPEVKNKLCAAFSTTEGEENWDVFPLATLEREMEE